MSRRSIAILRLLALVSMMMLLVRASRAQLPHVDWPKAKIDTWIDSQHPTMDTAYGHIQGNIDSTFYSLVAWPITIDSVDGALLVRYGNNSPELIGWERTSITQSKSMSDAVAHNPDLLSIFGSMIADCTTEQFDRIAADLKKEFPDAKIEHDNKEAYLDWQDSKAVRKIRLSLVNGAITYRDGMSLFVK